MLRKGFSSALLSSEVSELFISVSKAGDYMLFLRQLMQPRLLAVQLQQLLTVLAHCSSVMLFCLWGLRTSSVAVYILFCS
jgi:hypothetical protein